MKIFDEIPDDPKLIDWIRDQHLFHVASAPLTGLHVNVSPKGLQTFKLVDHKSCWYLDLTGSGNETISHMYEPGNGRLTIMFEAFEGPPQILRFWGKGKIIERGSPEFERLMNEGDSELGFPTPEMLPGARAIIWLDIARVGTSCGYSVPFMKFESHRLLLNKHAEYRERNDVKTPDMFSLTPDKGLHSYWAAMNTWSLDGLPGIRHIAHKATKTSVAAALEETGLTLSDVYRTATAKKPTWLLPLLLGFVLGALLTLMPRYGLELLHSSPLSRTCIAGYCM